MRITRKPRKLYGILDDFDEVIRWTPERPIGRKFIVKTRPSDYEVACLGCGDALF